MHEYETKIDLCGSEYAALVCFEWDERPLIDSVSISWSIHRHYNKRGEYAPHNERVTMDITAMLDDHQLDALASEIMADNTCRYHEDKADADYWRKAA